MTEGRIIEIVSNLYTVAVDKKIYKCRVRGVFRKKQITPLVGDFCLFSKDKLLIEEILPRKNELIRPKVSNVDSGIVVISLKNPSFSVNLLDRFLTILEIKNIEPIICITKKDLVSEEELSDINKKLDYYKKIGYKVLYNTEIDKLKKLLKDKTTVFTGQTGAGKSTLLNKIDKNLALKIGEVSNALGRGRHTTRVVSLYDVCGGKVVDTPGFSSIDFSIYEKEEIKNAFIEFNNYNCIYKDCSHTNEVECNVKKAVEDNKIIKQRYDDYLKFIEEWKKC